MIHVTYDLWQMLWLLIGPIKSGHLLSSDVADLLPEAAPRPSSSARPSVAPALHPFPPEPPRHGPSEAVHPWRKPAQRVGPYGGGVASPPPPPPPPAVEGASVDPIMRLGFDSFACFVETSYA